MTTSAEQQTLYDWLREQSPAYAETLPKQLPQDETAIESLLHGLFNVRKAGEVPETILKYQDNYLQSLNAKEPTVTLEDLTPLREHIYLWQGNILQLQVDAIVNAANSRLQGCFVPNHRCIDNVIHTRAGMQLRNTIAKIMADRPYAKAPVGRVTVTSGYNLKSNYVFHTVGPYIDGEVTPMRRDLLQQCYLACLKEADDMQLDSLAFCCISTGEFHYPQREAAELAVQTVTNYLNEAGSSLRVIFNVFKDEDATYYRKFLTERKSQQ
ncbi:MAG: protein-ADP-ribose hydrolase [Aerococcus sp.]|nr:protein-ADP-ribose hydrolase [Aerococcus sp.]